MIRLIGYRLSLFVVVMIPHLLVLDAGGPWLVLGVFCGVIAALEEKFRTGVLTMILAVELALIALMVPAPGTIGSYAVPVAAGVCLSTILALLHWSQAFRRDAVVEPGVIGDEAIFLVLAMAVAVIAAVAIWFVASAHWPWFTVPIAAVVFGLGLLVALDALRPKPSGDSAPK